MEWYSGVPREAVAAVFHRMETVSYEDLDPVEQEDVMYSIAAVVEGKFAGSDEDVEDVKVLLENGPATLPRGDADVRALAGSVKLRGKSPTVIKTYAERMGKGEMPPAVVVDSSAKRLIEGGHRLAAAAKARLKTIPAIDIAGVREVWTEHPGLGWLPTYDFAGARAPGARRRKPREQGRYSGIPRERLAAVPNVVKAIRIKEGPWKEMDEGEWLLYPGAADRKGLVKQMLIRTTLKDGSVVEAPVVKIVWRFRVTHELAERQRSFYGRLVGRWFVDGEVWWEAPQGIAYHKERNYRTKIEADVAFRALQKELDALADRTVAEAGLAGREIKK